MSRRKFVVSVLSALYFGCLIGLTFLPGTSANRAAWYWPFLAFVPVGILLVLLMGRRRWWAAIAFAALGAAWIEAAQSIWMPVGYADGFDVIWATSGAVLGVIVAVAITTPSRRPLRSDMVPQTAGQITPSAESRRSPSVGS